MTDVKLALRGLRGESFADIARRTGSIAGTVVSESATDPQVLSALVAAASLTSSITSPNVYASTAAGLAAVSNGQLFWVEGDGLLSLYRDDSGSATLLAELATTDAFAQAHDVGLFGDITTQAIDTNLSGSPIGADIGQLFIGNTVSSADAITIDSGPNFPPGIALRKYRGTPGSPTVVVAGDQTGYIDFRGYSGTEMWNHASIDAVVDGLSPFTDGELPPAKLRFATASDDEGALIRMEIRSNGRVEVGAINGEDYYGPVSGFDPKFYVTSIENDWAFVMYAQPATGAGYAFRPHTLGQTSSDYLIGASSGTGTGTFKFTVRGNGDVHSETGYHVGGTKVVAAQGAAVANATDAASAITQLNALLARCRAHGLIAT
jgi:hypothetical protein